MVFDEMAAMSDEVVNTMIQVLPEGIAFFGISTVRDANNAFNELIRKVNTGAMSNFRVLQVTLVCDDCVALGKTKMCRHKLYELPPHLQVERLGDIGLILGDDRQDVFLQEALGVENEGEVQVAFAREDIEYIMKTAESADMSTIYAGSVSDVFVSIDPAGEGRSMFAVMSCAYNVRRPGEIMV